MKKANLLFSLFFLHFVVIGQVAPYSKVFSVDSDYGLMGFSTCKLQDQSIAYAGRWNSHASFIMKTSSTGELIWNKQLGLDQDYNFQTYYDIISTPDSGMFAVGRFVNSDDLITYGFYTKIDKDGNIQWYKTSNLATLQNTFNTSDNGYILTGHNKYLDDDYLQLSIAKLSIEGNIEWAKTIKFGDFASKGLTIKEKENGNFIISGYFSDEDLYYSTALITEISNTGEIIWTKAYLNTTIGETYEIEDFIIKESELYLLMSNGIGSIFVKTDETGNILFSKEISNAAHIDIVEEKRSLYINDSEEFIFVYNNSGDGGFVKIDSDGNVLNNISVFCHPIDVLYTEENGLLVVGNGPVGGSYPENYGSIGLIQMNSDGSGTECTEVNESLSIDFELEYIDVDFTIIDVGEIVDLPITSGDLSTTETQGCLDIISKTNEASNNDFMLYPNPNLGIFSIESNLISENILSVYNSLGVKILEKNVSNKKTEINFSNHPKGIYLLNINSDDNLIHSQKMIVQ